MDATRLCHDCQAPAPRSSDGDGDSTTLISVKYGWRLTREKGPDGHPVPIWRCPTCWRAYKEQRRA